MKRSLGGALAVGFCVTSMLWWVAPVAANHQVLWGAGTDCGAVSNSVSATVGEPVALIACVRLDGAAWVGHTITVFVHAPNGSAESQVRTDGAGVIRFEIGSGVAGQTVVDLCDADGCVYGRVTIDVVAAPPPSTTLPATTTTSAAIDQQPRDLLSLWTENAGIAIDPASVVASSIFTGQPHEGAAPSPFLIPSEVVMYELLGDPADLSTLVDCGGIAVCSAQFGPSPMLQVYGVRYTGNLTDPPPAAYGVNFNFDTDPALGGRFISGIETQADCAIAGSVFGGDVFGTTAQVVDPAGEFVEVQAPLAFVALPGGGLLIMPSDHRCAGATGFQASTHVLESSDVVVEYSTPATGAPLIPVAFTRINISSAPSPTTTVPAVTTTLPAVVAPPSTVADTVDDPRDEPQTGPAPTPEVVDSVVESVSIDDPSDAAPAIVVDGNAQPVGTDGSSFPWIGVAGIGALGLVGGLALAFWPRKSVFGGPGGGGLLVADPAEGEGNGPAILEDDDPGDAEPVTPILVATEAMLQSDLESFATDAGAQVAQHFEELAQLVEGFGGAYINAVGGAGAVEAEIEEAGENVNIAAWADLAVMVLQISRLALGGIRGGLRVWTWLRTGGKAAPQAVGLADDAAKGFAEIADGLDEVRAGAKLPNVVGAPPTDLVVPTWWKGMPSRYWEASQLAKSVGDDLEELMELFQRGRKTADDLLFSLRRRFAAGTGAVVPDEALQGVASAVPFSMRLFERGASIPLDKLRQLYQLENAAGGTAPFLERLSKAVDLDQLFSGTGAVDGVQRLVSPAGLQRMRLLLEAPELRRLALHPPTDAPHGMVELTLEGGQKLRVFVGAPSAPSLPVVPGTGAFPQVLPLPGGPAPTGAFPQVLPLPGGPAPTGAFPHVLHLPPTPGSAPTGAFPHVLTPPGAPDALAAAVPLADRILIDARAALIGTGTPDPVDVSRLQQLLSAPAMGLDALGRVILSTPNVAIRPFSNPDLVLLGDVLVAGADPDAIRAATGPIPVALLVGSTRAVGDAPVPIDASAPALDSLGLSPQWFLDQQTQLDDVGAVLEGAQLGSLEHRIDELMISDDIDGHDFSLFGMPFEAGGAAARFGWAFSHLVEAPITTMTRWAHEDDLVGAWNDFVGTHRPDLEHMVHSADGIIDGLRGLSTSLGGLRGQIGDARGQLGGVLGQLRARTPDDSQRIDHIAQKLAHVDGLLVALDALAARAAILADWLEPLVMTPHGTRRDASTLLDPTAIMRIGRTLLEVGNLTAGVLGLGSHTRPNAPAEPPRPPLDPGAIDDAIEKGRAETEQLEQMTDEEFKAETLANEAAERAAHEQWLRDNTGGEQ